jgi:hypothetical protein
MGNPLRLRSAGCVRRAGDVNLKGCSSSRCCLLWDAGQETESASQHRCGSATLAGSADMSTNVSQLTCWRRHNVQPRLQQLTAICKFLQLQYAVQQKPSRLLNSIPNVFMLTSMLTSFACTGRTDESQGGVAWRYVYKDARVQQREQYGLSYAQHCAIGMPYSGLEPWDSHVGPHLCIGVTVHCSVNPQWSLISGNLRVCGIPKDMQHCICR